MSYHDDIYVHAQRVEQKKSLTRVAQPQTVGWTDQQAYFLHGARLKVERLLLGNELSYEKRKDDIVDAYNYLALLYNDLTECERIGRKRLQ